MVFACFWQALLSTAFRNVSSSVNVVSHVQFDSIALLFAVGLKTSRAVRRSGIREGLGSYSHLIGTC